MVQFTVTAGTYEVYEAGTYTARLREVVNAGKSTMTFGDQEPKERLQFTWDFLDAQDRPTGDQFVHWVNLSTGRKATLLDIGAALLDIPVAEFTSGMQVDTDTWIGKSCQLNLSLEKNQKGEDANRVKGYSPIRRGPPIPRARPSGAATAPVAVGAGVGAQADDPF